MLLPVKKIARIASACQLKTSGASVFLNSIGQRISYARKQAGLSQAQLAELVGTKPGTIGDKEVDRGKPSGPLLKAIEYATGFSVDWLVTGEGEPLVSREIDSRHEASSIVEPKTRATEVVRRGGDPAEAVPPELSDGELLILEFGAWVRRRLRKSSQQIDELEIAVDRLQQEVQKGRIEALKAEVLADPETWGASHLRALVMVLPAQHQKQLLEWLADQISGQADREQGPVRETAAGGE